MIQSPADIQLPIRLRPSLWKTALLLLVSLGFVAGGLFMARDQPLAGYASAAFFGLGVVVGILQMFPNSSYLDIDRDGFTACTLFRRRVYTWNRVENFGVMRIQRYSFTVRKFVGFNFSDIPAAPRSKMLEVSRDLCGFHACLPDTYGMKAEELADIMNKLREKFAGGALKG